MRFAHVADAIGADRQQIRFPESAGDVHHSIGKRRLGNIGETRDIAVPKLLASADIVSVCAICPDAEQLILALIVHDDRRVVCLAIVAGQIAEISGALRPPNGRAAMTPR